MRKTTLETGLLPGERALSDTTITFVDDFDGILAFRRWLSESRGRTILAADSETTGLDTYSPTFRVRLVQFGDENEAWVINTEKYPGIAQEALETYTDTDIAFHNASYDAVALMNAWPGFKFPWTRVHDTMLYHRLHDSEKPAGLKPVSQAIFGAMATRGQDALNATMAQNGWTWATVPMSAPAYSVYSGGDVILTARLWRRLDHIHTGEFADVARLEMDTLRICTEMSRAGMRIDRDYCSTKRAQLRGWVEEVMGILKDHHGINIRSSAQLARYFESQGAVIHETTPKGAPSMGKETMERLAAEGFTVAKTILDVRKADKLASSYFDNLIDFSADDGSVHASINTIAARTGRMSITNPALQTLPAGDSTVRHAFLPDNDHHSIISCDFGQIELRLTAALSGDAALVDVFREADKVGGDFFTMVGERLYGAGFQKSDPRRKLLKNTIYGCLPTDVEILTDYGWLTYDQVQPGMRTVGYNFETGESEWTDILATNVYDDAPTVRMFSGGSDSFVSTPNHRWVADVRHSPKNAPRHYSEHFRTTEELRDGSSEWRIILSAPAPTVGEGLPISDQEAALIGWALTDGTLRVSDEDLTARSQSNGAKRMTLLEVRQSARKHASEVDSLMTSFPHSKREPIPGYFTWTVPSPTARDLAERAGIPNGYPDNWSQWALRLSASQRVAMLEAMRRADGDPFTKGHAGKHEMYAVLTYLEGGSPRTWWEGPDRSGWSKKPVGKTRTLRDRWTMQRTQWEDAPTQRVWCPTTGLGSWTARQNGRVFLTGNSSYGAGIQKMADSAKVPFHEMEAVATTLFAQFPGIRGIMDIAAVEAEKAFHETGRHSITNRYGRRVYVDEDRVYSAANFLVQSTAADEMKRALVRIDKAGLGPYMRLPVHDEIVMSVPTTDADEIARELREAMTVTEDMGYGIPIPADPEGPWDRWKAK